MFIGLSTLSRRTERRLIVLAALCVISFAAHAGLDHQLAYDQSSIWNRNVQLAVEYSAVAITAGGALWLGSGTEPGNTFWQAADAEAISAVAAQGMKYAFRRARPNSGLGLGARYGCRLPCDYVEDTDIRPDTSTWPHHWIFQTLLARRVAFAPRIHGSGEWK